MRKRTGQTSVFGSVLAASVLCLGATVGHAAQINVGSASGEPGSQVTISVTLATEGAAVAGTQNDITFDASTPIIAKANGKPDCTVNPEIGKEGTAFSFRPAGCTGASCTAARALVLSLSNTDPIPDGSVLYTCNVSISSSATPGDKPLAVSGIVLSDPAGSSVPNPTGTGGAVTVGGEVSCPSPRPAPAGPAVWVEDQTGEAGAEATITVKLASGGRNVAGTQNDITFDPQAPIALNGVKPACTVNPAIGKEGTAFSFRPAGCSGSSCTAVRALVLSLSNVDEIPDGSVLYTCRVNVAAGASGNLNFAVSGVNLSDPSGGAIAGASGQDGSICLGGTPPVGQCDDPRPAPAGPAVWIQDQEGSAGAAATISVRLASGGASVAGTQNDITFDAQAPIAVNGVKPACTVNPAIGKEGTAFSFRPPGCTPGTSCTTVRALVLSLSNVDVIPDGSVLYTCNVNVAANASQNSNFVVSGVNLSDPAGGAIAGASGQDGLICIPGVQPEEPTPTPTDTRVPDNTPTPTVTSPPAPTATATQTKAPTAPPKPAFIEDEGGCQIGTSGRSSSGWLLLIPAVGLLVLRRRR